MNIIDNVTINGFWGERSLEFGFNDDVNFIIGINGSGKTTAVNLIVAALDADFELLDRLEFSKIVIRLKSFETRKKPSITLIKQARKDSPFSTIEYKLKESSNDKAKKFSLDDYEEQMMLRKYPRHIMEREIFRRRNRSISVSLKNLANVSWLSVHRTNNVNISGDDDRYESTVDKKLKELSNRLVRYFSSLGKQGSGLLEDFQKTVFLSMLHKRSNKALFSSAKELDLEKEQADLEEIFSQFQVKKTEYKKRTNSHFEALNKARIKLDNGENVALSAVDISVLLGSERIEYIVAEWNSLLESREKIFEPRNTFLNIVNSMMQRKEFSINDENELSIVTQSGKDLPVRRLSSGEKQLLIVLGEALLQEKKSWVYIADEPELSLHVRWQESLVENLRAINPNAQIIFATHSPDVVSHFGDRVFDMEKMF